jgi:hypothetical protein
MLHKISDVILGIGIGFYLYAGLFIMSTEKKWFNISNQKNAERTKFATRS